MRIPRKILTILLATAVVAPLGACAKEERHSVELQAALARTRRLSGQFVYEEVTNEGQRTTVRGVVEDDFRYSARLEVDGTPVLDEVVADDALADRFNVPDEIPKFLRKEAPDGAAESVGALTSRKWVVDTKGAPSLFARGTERKLIGDDPIYDARTIFTYVENLSRRMPVGKFNEDALDYKPKEDPFPKPKKGSDVIRYDFYRWPVPRPSTLENGGNQIVPGAEHFRKMAVYVRDGIVFRILEDIDVASRLDTIERNYEVTLEGSTRERVAAAVKAINTVRQGQGNLEPVRARRLSFELRQQGEPQQVSLPSEYVEADLSVLVNRGSQRTAAQSLQPGSQP